MANKSQYVTANNHIFHIHKYPLANYNISKMRSLKMGTQFSQYNVLNISQDKAPIFHNISYWLTSLDISQAQVPANKDTFHINIPGVSFEPRYLLRL